MLLNYLTGIGYPFSDNAFLVYKRSFNCVYSLVSNHLRINSCIANTIFIEVSGIRMIKLMRKRFTENSMIITFDVRKVRTVAMYIFSFIASHIFCLNSKEIQIC